jgi:hypothetical protein
MYLNLLVIVLLVSIFQFFEIYVILTQHFSLFAKNTRVRLKKVSNRITVFVI